VPKFRPSMTIQLSQVKRVLYEPQFRSFITIQLSNPKSNGFFVSHNLDLLYLTYELSNFQKSNGLFMSQNLDYLWLSIIKSQTDSLWANNLWLWKDLKANGCCMSQEIRSLLTIQFSKVKRTLYEPNFRLSMTTTTSVTIQLSQVKRVLLSLYKI